MANHRMEMYYNATPYFRNDIKIFVQNIIDKDENLQNTWEFFEHDGKFFDVNIFKDQSLVIKAYVFWTLFRFIDNEDLFITQEHDVMPLGNFFQANEKGADYVSLQA